MKNKSLVLILIVSLLLPLLTITAFAADDVDNAGMLDGIGGFFRDIYNRLTSGFSSVVTAISGAISDVLSAIKSIINAISNAISDLLDGIKRLFVPSSDYFPRIQDRLQNAINNKLGGILSLTEYLKNRFALLSSPADIDRLFILEFPQGHIFGGTRIDLLMRVRNFLPLFRGLLTAVFVVFPTGIFAYKRVRAMIKT